MRGIRKQIGGLSLAALVLGSACTSTDVLNTGTFEVAFPTVTAEATEFECVTMHFTDLTIRPLDGVCSPESDDPGDLCGKDLDCPNGTCQGVMTEVPVSQELIGNLGIAVVLDPGVSFVSFTGRGCDKVTPPLPERTLPPVTVSTGNYLIESLQVAEVRLIRANGTQVRCNGSTTLSETYTTDQRTFFVGRGRSNTVSFVLDVDAALPFLPTPPAGCSQFGANAASFMAIVAD